MEKIEWDDVQRIVLSGYGRLPYSAYLLWRFEPGDGAARKAWLVALADRLRRAGASEEDAVPNAEAPENAPPPAGDLADVNRGNKPARHAINLALTASGLAQLGIAACGLSSFSNEFLEGMAPQPAAQAPVPRRSNILGDLGDSSPEFWDWGGWKQNRDIDGLLLLFAADAGALRRLVDAEMRAMAGAARPLPVNLEGRLHSDLKEHFGYRDGISQPLIEGRPGEKRHDDPKQERISLVKPGEFLLGYLNERGARVSDNQNGRARDRGKAARRDPRRNGTYLVFRQLEQDVSAFDDFVSGLALGLGATKEAAAACLVGRLPDGTPLVPAGVDAQEDNLRNDFLYHYEDRFGLACPIGAHIRRANPRDIVGPDPDTALRLSKMHRIIRRGRPYGEKWGARKEKADGKDAPRGLLFIALNADIAGQFEMIQHSWLNNPHFDDLYAGTDPISHYVGDEATITIQRRPTNLHIKRPAPFVRVRGGAYFFLPGIQALRDMAA